MDNLSDSASKKVVLMLDNEPLLIDRRIILEATTLVDAGYKVILATLGDGIKPDISYERGIEIRRFPVAGKWISKKKKLNRLVHSTSQITEMYLSPDNLKIQNWITKNLAFLPSFLKTALYNICCPPVLAAAVRKRFPKLKYTLGRAFDPLFYLLLLRPKYLMPYIYLLFYKLSQTPQLEPEVEPEPDISKIIQDQIISFATQLKPDFIHAHDLPNLGLGVDLARQLKACLVYDAHELYPFQFFSNEKRQSELANLEKSLIVHTDAVIAVNKQCEDVLRETYSSVKEIIILNNATESPLNFNPSIKTKLWHERFNLDESIKIMVFQGGINPLRHVDHLLRAMTQLPDSIHIGFITYNKDIPYYKKLTEELGLTHRVHYVIEIPWDEVIYWLAAADVGMMPYQASNLNAKISSPNKLFEFVVAGLPIIASSELENVKNAIDTYGLGVHRFFREDDSYIEAITEMFAHGGPDRFKQNILDARHLFTWSNEAPRLIDLYARLPELHKNKLNPINFHEKNNGILCAEL